MEVSLKVRSTPQSILEVALPSLNSSTQIISPVIDLTFALPLNSGQEISLNFVVNTTTVCLLFKLTKKAGKASLCFIAESGEFYCEDVVSLTSTGVQMVTGTSNRQKGSYAVLFVGSEGSEEDSNSAITSLPGERKLWYIGVIVGVVVVVAIGTHP